MKRKIPLLAPDITEELLQQRAAHPAALLSSPDASLHSFHQSAKPFFPAHTLLGLSSATAGLHLALRLLKVEREDLVLCPTFTFAATVNAILYQQAVPVFIDSEENSWNMDPDLLEQALSALRRQKKKVAAIILVHAYGMPAAIDQIMELAAVYGIPLVEDAAPALGSYYKGKMAGTYGHFGVYSFNYNKIATTTGGGLLVSKDVTAIEEAHFLANQARAQAPYYLHDTFGYNYRMNGLAAEIGSLQFPLLAEKLSKKKAIFETYKNELNGIGGIYFQEIQEEVEPNHWLTSFLLPDEETKNKLYQHLHNVGIECRMLWRPMHCQPAYHQFKAYNTGQAEDLFKKGLSLPSSHSLSEEEQAEVIGQLRQFFI